MHEITHAVLILKGSSNGHDGIFADRFTKIVDDYYGEQIERLQEQLKEANEVIKTTNRVSGNIDLSQMVYEDRRKVDGITMQTGSYLEKWGVK